MRSSVGIILFPYLHNVVASLSFLVIILSNYENEFIRRYKFFLSPHALFASLSFAHYFLICIFKKKRSSVECRGRAV